MYGYAIAAFAASLCLTFAVWGARTEASATN